IFRIDGAIHGSLGLDAELPRFPGRARISRRANLKILAYPLASRLSTTDGTARKGRVYYNTVTLCPCWRSPTAAVSPPIPTIVNMSSPDKSMRHLITCSNNKHLEAFRRCRCHDLANTIDSISN